MKDDDTLSIFDVKDVMASCQAISSTEQIRHEKLYNCIIFKLRSISILVWGYSNPGAGRYFHEVTAGSQT